MIIDDVIWEVINNGMCAFKTKTVTNTFCKNQYNLTGLCNRNSCPLANSRYSTVLEEKGVCYLYMKTAERAHTPNEMWEKLKLDQSYKKALEMIEENLQYWPEFLKHKSKQRFTRIRQMLIKKKKMKLEGSEQYEVISRKAEKREKSRLVKAEKAALIDRHIEEELLKNLQSGKYKDIWNVSQKNWEKVLDKQEIEQENEEEFDSEEIDNVFVSELYGDEGDDGEEDAFTPATKKGKGYSNDEDAEDLDHENKSFGSKKTNSTDKKFSNKKRARPDKKKGKLNMEYEYEDKNKETETNYNNDW